MWPQIFAAATMNAFNSPSHQRPPQQCGQNFLANRVVLSEGDYCIFSSLLATGHHRLSYKVPALKGFLGSRKIEFPRAAAICEIAQEEHVYM